MTALLEQMGLPRLEPLTTTAAPWYFESAMHSACEVAGPAWLRIAEQNHLNPPKAIEGARELKTLATITTAFEETFAGDATNKLKEWGRRTTERALAGRPSSSKEQKAIKLVPGRRRLGLLLKGHLESLDEMRGEPSHAWREIDPHRYWTVHYGNPYALNRRRQERSCHFWIGAYEAMLRWAGLANEWLVDEIECGCVTGTGDCVFAIRSTKG